VRQLGGWCSLGDSGIARLSAPGAATPAIISDHRPGVGSIGHWLRHPYVLRSAVLPFVSTQVHSCQSAVRIC